MSLGPVFGPIIGAFVTQYVGWRWANWLIMIWGAVACAAMMSIKETYAPALLQSKAKKMRKAEGEDRYWSRFDVRVGFVELMKVNLSRPFSMSVKEPICMFWNVYIGIIYGKLFAFSSKWRQASFGHLFGCTWGVRPCSKAQTPLVANSSDSDRLLIQS